MTLGRYLGKARELRGVTLEEVAEVTKISSGTLRAIEEDDAERLPERVYMLGYLRAYAEAVGLDTEDVLLRYEELHGAHREAAEPASVPEPGPRRGWWLLAALLAAGAIALFTLVS